MSITQDATSLWYVPASSSEWTQLLSGTGIANPDHLWLMQEASGNLADSIGSIAATVTGCTYQASVSGWSRKGLSFADASSNLITFAGLPNSNANSSFSLMFTSLGTTPAATRTVEYMGGAYTQFETSTGKLDATLSGTVAGTHDDHGTVRLIGACIDQTNTKFTVYTDNGDSPSPSWVTPNSVTSWFQGAAIGTAPAMVVMYTVRWERALTAAQVSQLYSVIQNGPLSPTVTAVVPGNLRYAPGSVPGRFALPKSWVPAPPPVIAVAPSLRYAPGAVPMRFATPKSYVPSAAPPVNLTPGVGIGPAGAATFAMRLESGAKVTYSWVTDVEKAWSGLEQRIARIGQPQQAYEFTTQLTDAQFRAVQSAIEGGVSSANTFLLGLSYEAQSIAPGGSLSTVPVYSTVYCDWAQPGQRAIVVGPDGISMLNCIVQSVTSNSIVVDVDVSLLAKPGGMIMPAIAVYLDAQQPFGRYPVNVGTWDITARAALFGFGGTTVMGAGVSVTTYGGMAVWDHGIVSTTGTVAQPLASGAERADLGAKVTDVAQYTKADWGRALRIESSAQSDFQWLKGFCATVRGRQRTFLAPTGRTDLVAVDLVNSGTTIVLESPTAVGLPTSSSTMQAALGGRGTWTNGVGWLLDDTSGNLKAVFGSPNMTYDSGSPSYANPGFRGPTDKSLGFTTTADRFQGGNVLDIGATDDFAAFWVGYQGADPDAYRPLMAKNAGAAGWSLTVYPTGGALSGLWLVGNNGSSTTLNVPAQIVPHGVWYAAGVALDRVAGNANIATQELVSGVLRTGTLTTVPGDSYSNATNFSFGNDYGGNGAQITAKLDAAYAVKGSGVAAGIPANIAAALTSFTSVVTSPIIPAPDYANIWFTSLAHRRLAVTGTDGSVTYRTVTSATDNGNGTQSLGLDSALGYSLAQIASISFLEQMRLESDDVPVSWNGHVMSADIAARVVQQ